jgi:sodium/hydrogen antiporter
MLLASRWRVSPAVVALGLGLAMGRSGLGLIQPQLAEEGGQVETVCQAALLTSLFCVGLRLQAPFVWSRWRVPVRLATLSLPVGCLLAAAAAKALFDVSVMQSLLIASVLAPTDGVLAADAAGGPVETSEADTTPPSALAAEGAFTSALAVPAVALVLAFMGLESRDSESIGWLTLGTLWVTLGGIAAGAAIGAGMSRWIALLDFERQTDMLEVLMVFTTAALAYGAAEAIHTSGFLAVVAAGLALAHGGRWGTRRRKRPPAPGVLKIAARVERAAVLCVVMLVGAMSPDMDFRFRALAFAAILLGFIRPLAVRLGLSVLAPVTPHRKQIEWIGVRGAASLYCLAFAIDHGLGGRFAHQLAGITLLVMAGSILAHGLTASPLRTASPGALSS